MKSRGKKKRNQPRSSRRFSGRRTGDHAAPERFSKKAAWPLAAEKPAPTSGGQPGASVLLCLPLLHPQGRALGVSTRGRHREVEVPFQSSRVGWVLPARPFSCLRWGGGGLAWWPGALSPG